LDDDENVHTESFPGILNKQMNLPELDGKEFDKENQGIQKYLSESVSEEMETSNVSKVHHLSFG